MPLIEYKPASRSGTLLVAASDAPRDAKRVAQYVCDGTADDVQIQAAIDSLVANRGGTVMLSPGTFNTTSQIYLNDPDQRVHLTGYGSRIVTSGGIWAVTFETTGAPISPNVISGVTIYQQGDADALGGIRMLGAPNTTIRDVTIVADGDCTSYVACILGARDVNNDGPYWSNIQNVWIRKDAGGNGSINRGIYLRDNANFVRVIGGGINNCTDAILCDGDEEAGIDLDSLTCIGVAFEGCTDAIELNGVTDSNGGSGIKIIGCRAEAGTNFIHVNGRGTTGYVEAPQLIGNWVSASVTNYITFTGTTGAGQDYISLDPNTDEASIWTNGSRAITIDSSGNVGVGVKAPDGQLHVWKATAGSVTANSNADGIVLEGAGNEGISILSGSSSHGAVYFGDAADNNVGMIIYDHSANQFDIYANASLALSITDSGLELPVKTDGTRGSAGTAGRIIFNSTDGNLNIDDGTNWILPDGTTT